jgi:hypothetical protein
MGMESDLKLGQELVEQWMGMVLARRLGVVLEIEWVPR